MLSELTLDIRTLAFIATLSAILQAALLLALWRAVPRSAGTPIWAAGGALLALGFVLLAFRHLLPDVLSIVVANLAIAGAHALYLIGIERYCRQQCSYRYVALVLSVTLLLFIVFGLVFPDTGIRVVTISVALVMLSGLSAWWLWRQKEALRTPIDVLMSGVFAVHAAFHFFRGFYTLFAERGIEDFMAASAVHAFAFIDVIAFTFISGIGFAVLIISSLHRSLEKELADNNRLFSVLAHDLRSPFGGLVNLTDLVQIAFAKDRKDQVEELAKQLSVNARQVLALLDDLLVWGQAEFKGEKPRSAPLDLEAVVEAAVAPQQSIASAKGIEIRRNLAVASAFGVRTHAEMILRNLLSNAVKFSRPGSEISVTSSRKADLVVVSVVDQGIGLSSATAAEPGGSGRYASRSGTAGEHGTGLGLSLCEDLCRNDGQRVWLEENPGGGVIASFTLNVWEPGDPPKLSQRAGGSAVGATSGRSADLHGRGRIQPSFFMSAS